MTPIVSVKPVALPAPGRGQDLHVRVTAPLTGHDLPVLLFSHGFGSSLDGYGPLADHWAGQGFVVLQPTYLDSRTVGLAPEDPRTPNIWRFRIDDAKRTLDHLGTLEAAVPGLAGRVDHDHIVAAGHSFGGQTTGALLGLRVFGEDFRNPRVRKGVLLATAGRGGDDLTPYATEHFPYLNPDFGHMTAPALVVAGDKDQNFLTTRGPDWMADPYLLAPGPKTLLTLYGAEHSLGGIPGYEARETTDEDPSRLALLQRLTTAYLRGEDLPDPGGLGRLETK
ncbi:alpha/beta hydrolase family protein [Actinoplanes sp. NPDC000266]